MIDVIPKLHRLILKRPVSELLTAFGVFTILSIVMTYPLILNFTSMFPGAEDIWQTIWYFWMTGNILSGIGSSICLHTNPFFSNYIFYPDGAPIIPFGTAYNQLLAQVLIPILGNVATLNLLYLSSFIISGFGAYLLVRHITKNNTAAIISGAIFTFAPYHFEHAFAGHLGSVTMQWIPFCALFLFRMIELKDKRDAILAAIFYILVSMSDMQYMVFMGTFIALFMFFFFVTGDIKIRKNDIVNIFIFLLISMVMIIPLNITSIITGLSSDNYLKPNLYEKMYSSVDLPNFFIPSTHHPVFGGFVAEYNLDRLGGYGIPWERVTYIGITVLALIIYASIRCKSKAIFFWQLSAIFFALLSLGPILKVFGHSSFFGFEVPMPYSIISSIIPGLNNSRTPGRYEVITLLSISVLAGVGIVKLMQDLEASGKFKNYMKIVNILPAILMVLILFEYLSVPFAMSDVPVPEFYNQLANDNANYAIVEIPASTNYTAGITCEYYQSIHHKKMVGGQFSRIPTSVKDFEQNVPYLRSMETYQYPMDLFSQNITLVTKTLFRNLDIRYVIIHKDFLTLNEYSKATDITKNVSGADLVYSDEYIDVYRFDYAGDDPYLLLKNNWYQTERWNGDGDLTAWMRNNATIIVHTPKPTKVTIDMNVISCYSPRDLFIYYNNSLINHFNVSTGFSSISLEFNTGSEDQELLLYTHQKPIRPIDVWPLISMDERELSIALLNCSVTWT